jgi:type I restriction enzyme S subunit
MQEIEERKSGLRGEVPEDWQFQELGKMVDEKRPVTYGIVQTGEYIEGGVPCIRVTDIINGQIDKSNLITTSKKISEGYKRTVLRNGDLIMALRGKIGQIAKVDHDLVGANLTRGVALIALKDDFYNDFILHQISSDKTKQVLERSLNGSALQELSIGILRKIPILLPPISEQRAIADCLSTWDEAIQTAEELIRQKELQKKWLMQQLLTGKKRLKGFSEEWKNTKMKKIGFIPSKSPLIKIENQRLLTVKLHTKGVEFNNSDRPIISSSGRPYYERFEGEILIGRQNIHNGGIGLVLSEHSGNICSNAISSFKVNPDVSLEFVLHYLVHPDHYKLIEIFMGGTGQKELSEKQFLNLEMKFPSSIKEQQAIAAILSESNRELDLLRKRLAKLQEQKKGLMQVLLTGKRRLRIKEL